VNLIDVKQNDKMSKALKNSHIFGESLQLFEAKYDQTLDRVKSSKVSKLKNYSNFKMFFFNYYCCFLDVFYFSIT
jgi:hypothetical protein